MTNQPLDEHRAMDTVIDHRAQDLIDGYKAQSGLIHRLVEGIGHEESVLQPPFPANCMNWILGHMLSSRNAALLALAQPPLWPEATLMLYKSGSDPIGPGSESRRFEDLVSDVDRTRSLLDIALAGSSSEFLNEIVDTPFGPQSRVDRVDGLQWHENFHLGQLDILRSMILDRRT